MADRRLVPVGWDEAVDLDKDPGVIPDAADVDVPHELRTAIAAAMARYPEKHWPRCRRWRRPRRCTAGARRSRCARRPR